MYGYFLKYHFLINRFYERESDVKLRILDA